MSPAVGTQVYEADSPPVRARGYAFTEGELNSLLANEVKAILQDYQGQAELETLLSGIATTQFADAALQAVVRADRPVEYWRVGEAIAESYLVGHRQCMFPWPGGRDLKNPDSSPAGTDLVGFQTQNPTDADSTRFSFAEVKTSNQSEYPPSLMYGRHGLKQQLDDLRDSTTVKDSLVKYLGLHANGRAWSEQFKSAAKRYIHDRSDVSIFGLLVRDVKPNPKDFSGRASKLSQQCPPATAIELLGLYFPAGSIASFPQRIGSAGEGT